MKQNENKFDELLQIDKLDIGSDIKKYKSNIIKKGRRIKYLKENNSLKKLNLVKSVNNNFLKHSFTGTSPRYKNCLTNTINSVHNNKQISDVNKFKVNSYSTKGNKLPITYSKKLTSIIHNDDLKSSEFSIKHKETKFVKSENLDTIENNNLNNEFINNENITNSNLMHSYSKENINFNNTNLSSYSTSYPLRKQMKKKVISIANNSIPDLNLGNGIKTSNNCSNLTIIQSGRNEKENHGNIGIVEKITSLENRHIKTNQKFINVDKYNESQNLFKNKLKKKEKSELDIRKSRLEILINKNFNLSQRIIVDNSKNINFKNNLSGIGNSVKNMNLSNHLENLKSLSHFKSNNYKINDLNFNSLLSQQQTSPQQSSNRKTDYPNMLNCISISNPILQASIFPEFNKLQGLNFGTSITNLIPNFNTPTSILNGSFGGYRLIKEIPKEIILKKKKLNTGLRKSVENFGSKKNLEVLQNLQNTNLPLENFINSFSSIIEIKNNCIQSESLFDERLDVDKIRITDFNNKFIKLPKDLDKLKVKKMFKIFGSAY